MKTFSDLQDFIELSGLHIEYSELVDQLTSKVISDSIFKKKLIKLINEHKVYNKGDITEYFGYSSGIENILQGHQLEKSIEIFNPSQLPDSQSIIAIYEPYVSLDVITPEEYLGKIIELVNESRGEVRSIDAISLGQLKIDTSIPLAEIIINFYDELKSITKGYASMNYDFESYTKGDLVKLDILLNGKVIDPLSMIKHKTRVVSDARVVCEKLKTLIPRQQIEVAIQGAVNSHIVARETIKPFRKDVTAGMYGGDISRRKKLLDKQKKGKKRMKSFGSVDVPKEVFVDVLKN